MHPDGSICNPLDLELILNDKRKKPRYLRISLLESITNNFSDDEVIGRGGFAVVYKGVLQNGNVAVKKLTQTLDMHESKFQQEIHSLMSVQHENIVRFLGYCSDTQGRICKLNKKKTVMAEERQRLLCFEYLPGSLDKYIKAPSGQYEWRTCYQIIKGICKGLHHLHQKNILHLDLKPANILLDHYMVPKIADFGLSKHLDENQTRAMTKNLFGTLGYMAPESFQGIITFKSDIYCLGIIIIEILTQNKVHPDTDIDIVLENLGIRFQTSLEDIPFELIRVCAEIGIQCTDNNPAKRPNTGCILRRLDEMESLYGFIKSDPGTSSKQLREGSHQEGTNADAAGMAKIEAEAKHTSIRLHFCNGIMPPIYHNEDVKSIKLEILDGDKRIESGPLSKLRIEVLALEGNFPYDAQGCWTSKEFREHIYYGRDGKWNVLAGKGTNAQLINGECHLGSIRFRESSCRTSSGMFIIAARVHDGQAICGRVQEAVMNPVVVVDRKKKDNEKSYPPKLDDGVHCLENISLNEAGAYCKKLKRQNIHTMEDFLNALYWDENRLCSSLGTKSKSKIWDKMVGQAKACTVSNVQLQFYTAMIFSERNVKGKKNEEKLRTMMTQKMNARDAQQRRSLRKGKKTDNTQLLTIKMLPTTMSGLRLREVQD